ncbi:unnamed protein product, partial [Allacma fusca]
MLQRRVFKILN